MRTRLLLDWGLPLLLITLLSVLYFFPYYAGYRFKASDQIQQDYLFSRMDQLEKAHGKPLFWMPSLFSGMPTYLIRHTPEGEYLPTIFEILGRIFRQYPPLAMFVAFLGFFLFLRVEGASWPWALAGALGFGLTSYYTNMIVATHWGKSTVLFSVPYILAGMGLLHRERWLLGVALSLIGWSGVVGGHHPQMAYYALAVIAAYGLYWLWEAASTRAWRKYTLALSLALLSAGAAGASRLASLLPYYQYGQYSIRGPSDLERETTTDPSLRSGLDKSYAQSYSATVAELWTLVIPDFAGGTSQEDLLRRLGKSSALWEALRNQGVGEVSFLRAMPTYWGGSPFSAGSFYVGVLWLLLIILGWMYAIDALDWLLLYAAWGAMLLSLGAYGYSLWGSGVLLALPAAAYLISRRIQKPLWRPTITAAVFLGGWGLISVVDNDPENTYKLTDWALEYLPFYNKFRAPSTWLVIMGFILPWLGIRGAMRFLAAPDFTKALYSVGLAAGIVFLIGVGASFLGFSFAGAGDAQISAQVPEWFMEALREDRIAIARQSAFRSLGWLALGGIGLVLTSRGLLKPIPGGLLLATVVTLDSWILNTAYFPRKEIYIRAREFQLPPPQEPYERAILADTSGFFRILPMHTNAFTDSRPSTYLENAGGYHPAKLKRYQQLIEAHLSRLEPEVLGMLAVRYVTGRPGMPAPPGYDSLMQTADGVVIFRARFPTPIAWLSPGIRVFPRVDQTLDSLGRYPSREVALLAEKDWNVLPLRPEEGPLDSTEGVECLLRTPNLLEYHVRTSRPRLLVLSEIYYPPDWEADIEGQPTPIIPANFVLRAVVVPAGEHKVRLRCVSKVHELGRRVSTTGSIAAWLLLAAVGAFELWRRRRA